MARVTQWIEVRMMPRKVVTFEEFKTYLGRLQKRGLDPLKIPGLPFTEEAFVLWWDRITVSEDLLDRWTRRFQRGEQPMNEPVQETTQTRRVA